MPLTWRRALWWIGSLLLILACSAGGWLLFSRRHKPAPQRRMLLVFGLDGGERRVLERLWGQGKLPHLRSIADRGVFTTLHTAYNSSPVIWTTIATGVTPRQHGITDFVVPTPRGDVPISSDVRRVPALWNMMTRVGRRTAVLGWWGSWPAEEINGYVVTDRALLDLERRVHPASYLPAFQKEAGLAEKEPSLFHSRESEAEARDRAFSYAARGLVRQPLDLLLLYFRSTDVVSHTAWKCFEPELFPGVAPAELEACRDRVPQVYEAVDQAIGRVLEAAPDDADVVVLSDHGFHAARREEVTVALDMDAVLERLGYLTHRNGGIDFAATRVYTYATPDFRRPKLLRFALAGRERGGRVLPGERAALRQRLEQELLKVTYESGAPVFFLREMRSRDAALGADFVVGVSLDGATPVLRIDGQPFAGAVRRISRLSGTHTENTHGIFLAAGPDIQPGARIDGIHVHDIAPTLLYGLDMPVAQDFAGRAWTELYTEDFRRAHPLRTIRSWGVRQGARARASSEDGQLLEELRALGYIN